MKIQITRNKALGLLNQFSTLSNLSGVKFAYAINRNKELLTQELKRVQELYKEDDDFNAYDKERVALAYTHAEKDEKGEAVLLDGGKSYKIADQEAFDKELKELQEKHKEAIEKREKQIKEVNDLLAEEVELEVFEILIEYVPEGITVAQMEIIQPFLAKVLDK